MKEKFWHTFSTDVVSLFSPEIRAFTLAEVLLTLAIIGVVAALTIPAVVTKATKQQYVTGVKKAFNTLKSVEREAIREYGAIDNWDLSNGNASNQQNVFDKYIKKYLDVTKDCKRVTSDCFASEYKRLDGALPNVTGTGDNVPAVITSDGMAFKYTGGQNHRDGSIIVIYIYVDINGKKGPNTMGRDLFLFCLINTGTERSGFRPEGSYTIDSSADPILKIIPRSTQDMVKDCNTQTSEGWSCAARVLSENGMNY